MESVMKGLVLSLFTSVAIGFTGAPSTVEAGGSHHHHHKYPYQTFRPVYPVVIYPNPYFVSPWYRGYYYPQPLPPVIYYNRY